MKRILCFGDSNTWGYQPVTGLRYEEDVRWTGVLQTLLGDEYRIVEAGINGRTSIFDDPYEPYKNGADAMGYALMQATPLDLVIIMLGSNDLNFTDAKGAAKGVAHLVDIVHNSLGRINKTRMVTGTVQPWAGKVTTKVLLMSPILVHPKLLEVNPESSIQQGYEKSLEFAKYYQRVAEATGSWYLNAAEVAQPSEKDGLHMEPEGHKMLAQAVAAKVLEIFQNENE